MKISKIQVAVAAALALATGNALALNGTNINGTEIVLRLSGATATDGALGNLFKITSANGGLCQDGTLDLYTYDTNKGYLYFCTGAANAGTGLTGQKIAVVKESNGGSANGITFVARATALNFIPFTAAGLSGCETASTTSVAATGSFAAYTSHACLPANTTQATAVPNAGISDIDPASFVGLGGVTAADAAKLTSTSTVGVTFNPIVSVPLRNALQTAQGLTSGSETLAHVPSLSLAQLRGIFSGSITTQSELYSYKSSTNTQEQVSSSTAPIYVCRRGNTSGTMTSFKILFLGQGCSKNAGSIGSFVTPDIVYTANDATGEINPETSGVAWSATSVLFQEDGTQMTGYTSVRVFAGSGSGDVRSCMNYHSTNSNWAVGVASTENKPANNANTYRYVRVDGAEPTLASVIQGRYPYFTENTLNRSSDSAASNFMSGTSGTALALYNGLAGKLGTPAALLAVNSSWTDAAALGTTGSGEGDTGLLDIPTAANQPSFPVTAASVRTKPVNSQGRNYTGTANNCNMSRAAYP